MGVVTRLAISSGHSSGPDTDEGEPSEDGAICRSAVLDILFDGHGPLDSRLESLLDRLEWDR